MGQERWVACEFCGEKVDPDAIGTYQFVCGWVKRREGGGGHGVSLPKPEVRFAHGSCIERVSKGTITQSELFRQAQRK